MSFGILVLSQPHFGLSVKVKPTLPKVGTWSPPGFLKTQKMIWEVKSPRMGALLVSLEKVLKCKCPKWPRMSHLDICSPSYGQKKGRESNCQFDSWPLKVGNRPVPNVRSRSATWCWKALFEGYKFGLDLVPIGGWGEELRSPKVLGVQTGTVSGLHFRSPEKKSHSDATPVSERKVYYREYGGGISWVRAVVCHVSPS
jgi:hypothetical protein